MSTTPDYPVLGPPRISAAGFAEVLRAAGSPASSEAAAAYGAALTYGVDPAVLLAIFRKESTFGRFGRAASTRSWGNIRNSDGSFRAYSSWTAGAHDTARLLAIYGRDQIRPGRQTNTVQTLPYVWAPSADGNAPDAYGDQLASWITDWQRRYSAVGSGIVTASAPGLNLSDLLPPGTTRETYKAALAAAGISIADDYRLTQADADKLAAAWRWPPASSLKGSINLLIYQALGQPNSFFPAFTEAANQNIADAIAGAVETVGGVVKRGGQALILAGIVILGLYLLARG